jgi:hypothetical protein
METHGGLSTALRAAVPRAVGALFDRPTSTVPWEGTRQFREWCPAPTNLQLTGLQFLTPGIDGVEASVGSIPGVGRFSATVVGAVLEAVLHVEWSGLPLQVLLQAPCTLHLTLSATASSWRCNVVEIEWPVDALDVHLLTTPAHEAWATWMRNAVRGSLEAHDLQQTLTTALDPLGNGIARALGRILPNPAAWLDTGHGDDGFASTGVVGTSTEQSHSALARTFTRSAAAGSGKAATVRGSRWGLSQGGGAGGNSPLAASQALRAAVPAVETLSAHAWNAAVQRMLVAVVDLSTPCTQPMSIGVGPTFNVMLTVGAVAPRAQTIGPAKDRPLSEGGDQQFRMLLSLPVTAQLHNVDAQLQAVAPLSHVSTVVDITLPRCAVEISLAHETHMASLTGCVTACDTRNWFSRMCNGPVSRSVQAEAVTAALEAVDATDALRPWLHARVALPLMRALDITTSEHPQAV